MDWEKIDVAILIRNDTTANWEQNKTEVLSKGEIGIEFMTDGKTRMKIGDGISSWGELKYFGDIVETGNGEPSSSIAGELGTKYYDTSNNKFYIKTSDTAKPWKQILTPEDLSEINSRLMTVGERTKLAGIQVGAEVNVQADWNIADTSSDAYIKNKPTTLPANGGNADTVGNKTVDDTKESSDHLWTASKSKAYADAQAAAVKAYADGKVADAIDGVTQFDIKVVDTLPDTGTKGIIYLVSHTHNAGDVYDEYVWIPSSNKYEKIGNTDIDLSEYVKIESLPNITVGNANKVNNHTVQSDVPVNAKFTDTTYKSGTNIRISPDNTIDIGENVLLQTQKLILNGGGAVRS